ncbi:hypothetical protein CBR_g12601 [Chara braunii]|uniref:Uncharacterized protein n=1 Tax=Chara braunii TaxID=69332 RepID=A0A388KS42_CHABU|nr:hypothetical protein CBR_g12601 [Chara braunii]|eukprot:GBG72881.1 hypothetical protein CBR_g12601 [Chara braunii]
MPMNRLDELDRTVASMHEFMEMESARRAKRELRRRERDEARRAVEATRAAEEERASRKLEKQRKREEEQMMMVKVVEVQLSMNLGDIREEIKAEVRKAVADTMITMVVTGKGKQAVAKDLSSSSSGATSDVEAITEGTWNLSIQGSGARIPPLVTAPR